MQVSIVNYGEALRHGFRVDAEYWQPEFLRNAALVSPEKRIGDFVAGSVPNIKSSPIGRDFDYLEIARISTTGGGYTTVPVLRGEEPDRAHYILASGDVAVSTVRPNRNAVALVQEDGIIGSSGLAVLRAKPDGLSPHYLYAFCKTGYFVKCLVRASKATMYPAVSNADVLNTPILAPTPPFESVIVELIEALLEAQELAELAYRRAETRLLHELGLSKWTAQHRLWFIRHYSELQRAGRMDAEYFQPKHDEIVAAIQEYPGGWDTLGNLAALRKGVEVGSGAYLDEGEAGVPFVRVSNLTPFEITEEKYISESLYAQLAARHQPQPGEILLTKDATPGVANYLREPPPQMIPSGGILRLQLLADRVDGEYLTLALNSLLVGQQVNRDGGGSVIQHWRPEQVQNTLIPLLPPATQARIREQIAESFAMRGEARRRLAAARGAVEIAIEQGEAAALEWLEAGAAPATGGGGAAAG